MEELERREEEGFLDWFAGFVAGEGYFKIIRRPDSKQYLVALLLMLRDDDLNILLEIQECLGIGTISRQKGRGNTKPSALWGAYSSADCQKLVEIFKKHPLRARKQEDFRIWEEAVIENKKPIESRDLKKMRYLAEKLKLVRSYEAKGGYNC